MKRNMGRIDKLIRFFLGIAGGVLVYYQVLSGPHSYILLVAIVVLLLTSLTGFCPMYGLLGISSCKPKN